MEPIVVDAMGGDNAPHAVIEGSVLAVNELGVHLILVGKEDIISRLLSSYTYDKSKIQVVHASEVIEPDESPVMAIRKKKDSSMVVGMNMVKERKGGAFISAGSTGALMAGALFKIGRIKGIDRPALAPVIPTEKGGSLLLDVGANTDVKPNNIVQFALMGGVYASKVLAVDNPKIAIVNIGTEEEKGNELTKQSFKLLKQANINFVGSVEARDIPKGNVDVMVCDGFVGNIVLKLIEGVASSMFTMLKGVFTKNTVSKLATLILKPGIREFKKKLDYTEHGGAPLLGIDGGVIKAHGSSDSKAIKNAIRQAKIFIENDVVNRIKEDISTNLGEGDFND